MESHLRGLRKADITKISTGYKTATVVSETKSNIPLVVEQMPILCFNR
jgi:hypothetical protein